MAEKRILYGADGSVIREMVVHDSETLTLVSTHEVDSHIAYAKARREAGSNPNGHYREVATIPPHVIEKAFQEGWAHDKNAWAKWFNDPQNKVFHTDDKIKRLSGLEGI